MKSWKHLLVLALVGGALLLPGNVTVPKASADAPITIRFASLAPPGSTFVKVLKAWNRTLKEDTEGRVELRIFSGSGEGDEREFIQKMKAGKLDAAGIATAGLSTIARPMLVLTAPGLVTEYKQLRLAREKLDSRFRKMLNERGFKLLAWGVAGKKRIFSTEPFAKPEDLKGKRAWEGKDNPVMKEYLKVIGANPLRFGAPKVRPGLKEGKIDVVPGSAMASVAFQWYTSLKYLSKDNLNIIIGASIIKKEKLAELTPADQKILLDTATRAAKKLDQIVVRDDAKSYQTLLKRGLQEVDLGANQAAWDAAAKKARERLVGKVYSKSLLQAVEAAVAGK